MSKELSAQELHDFYQGYVDLANNRDFDRMDEFAHDEVIVNGSPVSRDDMVGFFRYHTTAVPDLHWEIQYVLVEGNKIASRLIDTGTPVQEWNGHAPTGASISIAETAFYEIVDGRFKVMWYMMDSDALREQLAG